MSKTDVTTHDLFMRLGSTSWLRSMRADALFRRLRIERQDQTEDAFAHEAETTPAGDNRDAKKLQRRNARSAS